MNKTLIVNQELSLEFPEGFHQMDQTERSKWNAAQEGESFSDPEKHMIVSVAWKPLGWFVSKFVGNKDIARGMEFRMRSAMKSCQYHAESLLRKEIAQSQAEGFSYRYRVQETEMYGESVVFKRGRML